MTIKRRKKPRRGRLIDKLYLAWVREFSCLICAEFGMRQLTRTEAAHVGDRGLGQKCSDRETIPLCALHHREGPLSQHRLGKSFWPHWGIDRDKLIAQLNALYELLDKGEAAA